MTLRSLTKFEIPIAKAVVNLGLASKWEFAAYLETEKGRLIEIRTLMRDDGAGHSCNVDQKVAAGAPIVVHHNHLSQESLSFPDWRGLATMFDETFAHCADGTVYWGRVIDAYSVQKVINCWQEKIEMCAENELFQILNRKNIQSSSDLAGFFRKYVVNRAMKLYGLVQYEFNWGTEYICPYVRNGNPIPPAGVLGRIINSEIDKVACNLNKYLKKITI